MSTPAKKKLGLLPKLIIAIALGLIVGTLARKFDFPIIIRIGATFNSIFGNFLGFCIPLIIIGFVAPGIADLGSGAGKTLALTAGVAYLSTLIAGTFAYVVDSTVFPSFLKFGSIVMDNAQNAEDTMLSGLFTVEMPPLMGVMTALITSFILGIGIAATNSETLRKIFHEFQRIVEGVVAKVLIPLLPFHIYGIFANMTYAGTVAEIMSVFAKVFVLIIIMHLCIIVFQYIVAGAASKKNPFGLIKNMVPAYMTAMVDKFHKAGYHLTWISNQQQYGAFNNISSGQSLLCDERFFHGGEGQSMDMSVVDSYKLLEKVYSHNLFFFHLYGQHPEFDKRYPATFSRFKPDDYDVPRNQKNILAAYDNATLYNDSVVAAIISCFKDEDALVIYLADHGLDLFYTDSDYAAHGKPTNPKSDKLARQIPFMIYVSESFRQNHSELASRIIAAKAIPFCTELLIYKLLTFTGYKIVIA